MVQGDRGAADEGVDGCVARGCHARRQLLGVYDPKLLEPMARVLANLGSVRCLIVHGDDGIDEITTTTTSRVCELHDGEIRTYRIDPAEFGILPPRLGELRVGSAAESAAVMRSVFAGRRGSHRDIVVLNAAAALLAGGQVQTLHAGIRRAAELLDAGAVARTLDRLIAATNEKA